MKRALETGPRHGLTYAEIAVELGITEAAVKGIAERAMQKLKRKLVSTKH